MLFRSMTTRMRIKMDEKGEGFESFYYFFFILLIYFLTFLRKKLQKKRHPSPQPPRPQVSHLAKTPSIPIAKKVGTLPSPPKEIIRKPIRKRRPRIVKVVSRLRSKKDLILLSEVLSINSKIH